ncbi:MAG: hypothetical protein ACLTDS_00985 [Bianqueaceae bacterium]
MAVAVSLQHPSPRRRQAGVVLRVSAQGALHVEPDLIKTLLLNLVDNAGRLPSRNKP